MSIKIAKQILNLIPQIPKQIQDDSIMFYSDFLITISRAFEAYSFNPDGQRRFQQTEDFHSLIDLKFNDSIYVFKKKLTIKPFERNDVLEQAKSNIKQNIHIVKLIVNDEINGDQLDQYFEQLEVYQFNTNNSLVGISSYDGQRIYMGVIENVSSYFLYFHQIVKSMMDNIYFWFIRNKNPYLIMGEVNQNLVQSGKSIEAGDFYQINIFQFILSAPSPFRMNVKRKSFTF